MSFDDLMNQWLEVAKSIEATSTSLQAHFFMPQLEGALSNLGAQIGFPIDQLKTVMFFILAYPAAFFFNALPGKGTKHIFSIVWGLYAGWFCFGASASNHFISATLAYLIMLVFPSSVAQYAVFIFMMGYMSASHIYRMYIDYMGWSLDFTGPQMVLTIKLTSLAYNLYDGSRKDQDKVLPEHKEHAIKKLPNILEYYGFVYFFAAYISGPSFSIKDYLALVDGSLFDSAKDKKCPPGATFEAIKKFVYAILCIGIAVGVGGQLPVGWTKTPAWAELAWPQRFAYVYFATMLTRWKYYFAWHMADGAMTMVGMGYNGYDKAGNVKWNRVSNMVVSEVELAQSMHGITAYWNINTAKWLKLYVYTRVPFLQTYITYAVSAFWHGFYPGYYMFFFSGAFFTNIAREMRAHIRPFFVDVTEKDGKKVETPKSTKPLYDLGGFLATSVVANYGGSAFCLLDWNDAIRVWSSFHYIPHIIGVVIFLYYTATAKPKPRKDKAAGEKKAH